MSNLGPLLLGGAAFFMVAKGKKKKRRSSSGASGYPSLGEPMLVDELPTFSPGPIDKRAGSSKWKERQEALISFGYDVGPSGADGLYGKNTKSAIAEFQGDAGIGVDGIWGKITDAAMAEAIRRGSVDESIGEAIGASVGTVTQTSTGSVYPGDGDMGPWGGSIHGVSFSVHLVEGPHQYEYVGGIEHGGASEEVARGLDFDDVWSKTESAASDRAVIVIDDGCKTVLHIGNDLFRIQKKLAIEYALEDRVSSDDAVEIHESVLNKFSPHCASLGRSGVGDNVRSWWDQNVGWIHNLLTTYKNSPATLQADAEKHG